MAKLKSGTRIYGTATIDTSLVVGSAVTATSSGIQVAGIVTATSFSGSGTNLTGIVTSIVAGTNITVSGSTGQVTINSSSSLSISTNTTNQAQYLTYATGTGSTTGLGVTATGLVFNPSTRNLGIGTTNPTTRISIAGTTGISFADTNIRIGDVSTGSSITSGTNNFFGGASAGKFTTGGSNNNFFGNSAGFCNTTGCLNNFFGNFAGYFNTSGMSNNIFGDAAGQCSTGSFNNFFGSQAGKFTTGFNNNFIGYYAGRDNTSGCDNNFLGQQSGCRNTTGAFNNFFGKNSAFCNTTGSNNIAIGQSAGYFSNGSRNIFFGESAGWVTGRAVACTTGTDNLFVGFNAGAFSSTGSNNNFLGCQAGYNNALGSDNIFFGRQAGYNNVSGSQNVAIGYNQNTPITSGDNQLVIGAGNTAWINGNSSYNVGIGTTNPTSKLHVVGDGRFTGIVTATQLDLTASATASDSVLYLSGTPTSSSGTNGLFGIGALSFSDTDIIADFTHSVNSYAQLVVQNKNSGSSSSADIIVNNDRSAGTTYYGDFGINGTTFAAGGPFGDVDGTYLYSAGGTLSLGSLNSYDVKIATNNTERVRVSAGGSVGIGTTVPLQKLHVNGNLLVSAGSSTGQHITQKAYELNSGTLSWEGSAGQLFSITNNLTSGSIFSVNDVSGIPSIDVNADGTVLVAPYGGNVGFGTTSPTSKLHVNGQITSTQANSTTNGGGQIYLNGANGNRIDFNQSGVAAPATTTRSAGTKIVLFPNISATQVDYALGIDGSTLWSSVESSAASFKWYAGTTNIATLSGAGLFTATTFSGSGANLTSLNASNLGSGTVPVLRLGDSGTRDATTYLRGDNTWATISGGATLTNDTTTNATYYPTFSSATSGTYSTAYVSNTKCTFNPSTGVLSATVFTSLSDVNKKKNIRPIENAIEITKKLEGVRFDWKDTDAPSIGVIAQEVEKVLPELVAENDGVKSVSYGNIVGVLIEAIKEQQVRIEELERKLNA